MQAATRSKKRFLKTTDCAVLDLNEPRSLAGFFYYLGARASHGFWKGSVVGTVDKLGNIMRADYHCQAALDRAWACLPADRPAAASQDQCRAVGLGPALSAVQSAGEWA
jgi:hypothetical protein